MSDRKEILAIDILLYVIGIILIVAIIMNPSFFVYECGKYDIFCWDATGWGSVILWFLCGVGIIVVAIIISLVLWAGR